MGMLLNLLTAPLLAPVQGVTWIAEKLAEQADNELYNEGAVRGQLMELELRLDMGEISEDEFMAVEEALLERLKMIRARKGQ